MASSSLTTDQLKAFQLFQNLDAEDLELLLERHLCSSIAESRFWFRRTIGVKPCMPHSRRDGQGALL